MQDKLKNLEVRYGIEWQEFNVGKLFGKATRGKRLKSGDRVKGNLPFVTAGEAETGISSYIGNDVQVFSENTITIDMFGSAKYRGYKYGADDHIAVVHTEKLSREVGIFIATAINKSSNTGKFDYSKNFYARDADELDIKLPISNGSINYDFMHDFIQTLEAERIQTLEAERIQTLEAYLMTTGLKSYELTVDEEKILSEFQNGNKIQWCKFKISDVFNVLNYKKKFDANKVTLEETGFPYVVRTSSNNGIKGLIKESKQFLNSGNTVSFGQDTATMFYQSNPYFTGDKIKILQSRYDKFGEKIALFLITSMHKSFSEFVWGSSSFSVKIINNQEIEMPIDTNEDIDYEFMEKFIAIIQKVVIKDLVKWTDKKIELTKRVI